MQDNLLTAGEFARLARTTKRTIHWYDQAGILSPTETSDSGYRLYRPDQIIDFQVILLLRKLNFSIEEIKKYLNKNDSLKALFKLKHKALEEELRRLQRSLQDTENYYKNLESSGTLVKPKIKKIKAFDIYYLQKEGPYEQIYNYFLELKSYFKKLPGGFVSLSIFEDQGYYPKKAHMKIAIVAQKGMEIKVEAQDKVLKTKIPSFKALTYTHIGDTALLSMLWKQLRNYAHKHSIAIRTDLPFEDLEFYKKGHLTGFKEVVNVISEITLPIF